MGSGKQGSGKRRRAGWATGLSLVLHLLALTGMVLGLKVARPPPEDRAIELRLIRPFEPLQRLEPARQPAARSSTVLPQKPRPAPQSSSRAPVAAASETPAPAPAAKPKPEAGPKVYGPEERPAGPSGRMGCDNPLGIHLTADQQQACANNLARLTREAKPLDLIPPDKRAEYDHYEACRAYRRAGVPGKGWVDPKDDMMPRGAVSNIDPSYGKNPGMGYIPKGC